MSRFRLHQVLALFVLLAAAGWVLSGKFSYIGGDRVVAEHGGMAPAVAVEKNLRTVLVAKPEIVRYSRSVRMSGRTEPNKISVLAARDSGVIRALPATDGQYVSADTVLLSIDAPEKVAAIETATALLAQRQAQSKAAESMLERGGGARIAADIARAELKAAEAQLREAQVGVEHLDVLAPFSGILDDVSVERGSWVQVGTPVATILAMNPIIVRGEVSERDLADVRIGMPTTVTLANGKTVEGLVRYVRHQASEQTRTFQIEVEIPNYGGDVPAGMSGEIVLHADPIAAVVVPRSVVTLSDGGELGVRTVGDGDRVSFVPVQVVDDTPKGLVLDGVPAGAWLIISGQDLVKDGEAVRVATPALSDSQAGAPVGAEASDRPGVARAGVP